jgi:2-hydroxychromene-2-carboxylate isomerase
MTETLTFWYELASTYSYPAAFRIEAAAADAGIAVAWRPFLLGPIFRDQGMDVSPVIAYPAKGRYMWRDVARLCAAQGLPFRTPSEMPRNSLHAARIALVGQDEAWGPEFARAVYRANFADDADIADLDVLAGLLAGLGLDAGALIARSREPETKARLKAQTAEAAARGIFGSPSYTVGEELFWGGDRLEAALAWARGGD